MKKEYITPDCIKTLFSLEECITTSSVAVNKAPVQPEGNNDIFPGNDW